jgi:hypothetical protein
MKLHLTLLIVLACAAPALGHFVYIVPDAENRQLQIVFSEDPAPDEKVAVDKIMNTELFVVDANGTQTSVKWSRSNDHYLSAKLPAAAAQLIAGRTNYGVTNSRHTGNIPVLIKYYSKAVLGDPARATARLGSAVPLEIVPVVREGKLEFIALSGGRPLADADCVVKAPGDDKAERTKTTSAGQIPGRFDSPGRYGVWVRMVDLTPGEVAGARYDKAHSYATLVVDFPGMPAR